MNDKMMRMFLRTTICFKDIGKFSGKDQSQLYGKEYSGNHIAIFECELKAPPQMALIDHGNQDLTDSYRINFRDWKIVDIDNWMEGNPYFNEIKEEKVWDSKINAIFGETRKSFESIFDKNDPNVEEE